MDNPIQDFNEFLNEDIEIGGRKVKGALIVGVGAAAVVGLVIISKGGLGGFTASFGGSGNVIPLSSDNPNSIVPVDENSLGELSPVYGGDNSGDNGASDFQSQLDDLASGIAEQFSSVYEAIAQNTYDNAVLPTPADTYYGSNPFDQSYDYPLNDYGYSDAGVFSGSDYQGVDSFGAGSQSTPTIIEKATKKNLKNSSLGNYQPSGKKSLSDNTVKSSSGGIKSLVDSTRKLFVNNAKPKNNSYVQPNNQGFNLGTGKSKVAFKIVADVPKPTPSYKPKSSISGLANFFKSAYTPVVPSYYGSVPIAPKSKTQTTIKDISKVKSKISGKGKIKATSG